MTIPITILFNDKVCFITFFKVGSRATGALFERFTNQENIVKAEVQVDENFKIINDNMFYPGEGHLDKNKKDRVKKELDSILSGNLKKDIVILYREPLKRFLTGIIEEFAFNFKKYIEGDSKNKIISSIIDLVKFNGTLTEYEYIIQRRDNFILNDNFEILTKEEFKFYKKLFYHYIRVCSTNTLHSGHTYHYLTPLILLIETNENLKNNERLKLLNLELDKNKLQNTVLKYGTHSDSKESINPTSNSSFVKIINEMILEGDADLDTQVIRNSLSRYLLYENIGYKKLLNHPKNI